MDFDIETMVNNMFLEYRDMDFDLEYEKELKQQLTDGLYYLKTCAENEHNASYFVALYSVLGTIFDK